MGYKCVKSFMTAGGKTYYYGNSIHFSEYNNLAPYEKKYFELISKDVRDIEEEIVRVKLRKRQEEEEMKRRLEEEEEERRRRLASDDAWVSSLNMTADGGASYDPPSPNYDSPDNSSPDYGGGDSGGGGSDGNY
jgi:hypothetical protein